MVTPARAETEDPAGPVAAGRAATEPGIPGPGAVAARATVSPNQPAATATSLGTRIKRLPPPALMTITPIIGREHHDPTPGSTGSLALTGCTLSERRMA